MANLFKDAAQSYYSGHFYGELARDRKGFGFGLILFLTLLVSAMMCVGLLYDRELRDAIDQMPKVAADLPEMTMKDGALHIDKPVPYRIAIGRDPQAASIVIDTNYKLSDGTAGYMRDNHILALITSGKAILAKNHWQELEAYEFKDSQPFTVTHDQWVGMGATIAKWGGSVLILAFFVSFSIGMFLLNILATAFTAVAIMALDLIAGTKLEFPAAMRLAAAARIPVNTLPALPVLVGLPELAGASGWVLWGLYLIFAVWAVKLHSAVRA